MKSNKKNMKLLSESKRDWVANHGNTEIVFKNGYKYLSDEELEKMFYTVGDIMKKNKFSS